MAKKETVLSIENKEPLYVVQHSSISRSIYKMSPNARKTIALAMVYRKLKQVALKKIYKNEKIEVEDVLSVNFRIEDFFDAFDIEKSTNGIINLGKTLDEITGFKCGMKHENGVIEFLTWVTYAKIDKNENMIEIKFSEEMAKYLDGNELGYCNILIQDIAELKSFYAFRMYELAKSYESLSGKKGNKLGEWFFERSIDELRELLDIKDNQYKKFPDFRRNVIEMPLAEIDESNIGLNIYSEYKKDKYDGRKVEKVIFKCKIERKPKNTDKNLEINELKPKKIAMKIRKELVIAEVPTVKVFSEYKDTETVEEITEKDRDYGSSIKEIFDNILSKKSIGKDYIPYNQRTDT